MNLKIVKANKYSTEDGTPKNITFKELENKDDINNNNNSTPKNTKSRNMKWKNKSIISIFNDNPNLDKLNINNDKKSKFNIMKNNSNKFEDNSSFSFTFTKISGQNINNNE